MATDLCELTCEVYSDMCELSCEVYTDLCELTCEVYTDVCELTCEVDSDFTTYNSNHHYSVIDQGLGHHLLPTRSGKPSC